MPTLQSRSVFLEKQLHVLEHFVYIIMKGLVLDFIELR
jgi:hypothetical protein